MRILLIFVFTMLSFTSFYAQKKEADEKVEKQKTERVKKEKKKIDKEGTETQVKEVAPNTDQKALGKTVITTVGIPVVVTGQIFKASSNVFALSSFQGNGQYIDYAVDTVSSDAQGKFTLTANVPTGDFYVLRNGNNHVNLIITKPGEIKIFGDGRDYLRNMNIIGNDDSQALLEFMRANADFRDFSDSLQTEFQKYPSRQNEMQQVYQFRSTQFEGERIRFIQDHPNSGALIGPMQSIDPASDFKNYKTLAEQVIAAVPNGKMAEGLRANMILMEQQMASQALSDSGSGFLAPGTEAPDLVGPSPDGKEYRLSDLRGNVVLLDFWASWCGPCRKENPNVVKEYTKYKEAGFTVFSVSLDKGKEAWLAAIEKDGLIWPYHISDLLHWQSEISKIYQVRGIPFTVLIDAEGKIIGTNIRGAQLGIELQKIYGF